MRALYYSRTARPLSWYLCMALAVMAGTPGEALTAPLPPEPMRAFHSEQRLEDLATIHTVLETKLVRQRLADLGLTEQDISALLARLSDDELHELAQRADELQAGGDTGYYSGDAEGFAVFLGILFGLLFGAVLLLLVMKGVCLLVADKATCSRLFLGTRR